MEETGQKLCIEAHFLTSEVHVDKRYTEPVLKHDASSVTGTERLEVEANQFAAALLMPADILNEMVEESPMDIEDEGSIEELAKDVLVSKAALQYRLRNL
ncbi:MAG: hypothetical protein DMG39_14345 [Acidobacteria bacterium]|nr:MAG: hypothetical protein DMG39_14345 [Acidobacteriota bacterium]